MPLFSLELAFPRLFGALLLAVALVALPALVASHHPLLLKALLLSLLLAALVAAAWQEWRHGVRRLEWLDDGTLRLQAADGRVDTGVFAGHALLGSFVVFLFVGRRGWRRWLGPRRVAVWRDATGVDDFRRLRARVRLGARLPG